MNPILTSKITDFALGNLSPQESLKVLEEIEKSEDLSEVLDLVADTMNCFQVHLIAGGLHGAIGEIQVGVK